MHAGRAMTTHLCFNDCQVWALPLYRVGDFSNILFEHKDLHDRHVQSRSSLRVYYTLGETYAWCPRR